jgi:hypothetical protein
LATPPASSAQGPRDPLTRSPAAEELDERRRGKAALAVLEELSARELNVVADRLGKRRDALRAFSFV